MQVELYPAQERGSSETPWLVSRNTFSFGNYYHPKRINFGTLRVLNEDTVAPARGFSLHPHENMEIVSIVLEGKLEHRDTLDNHGELKPGDVQRITAGSGIRHSEMNPSQTDKVHFLQIWVFPEREALVPSYEQKSFTPQMIANRFCPIVSGKPSPETLFINQDAAFFLGKWDQDTQVKHLLAAKHHGIFVFVIEGKAKIGGMHLKTGDGIGIKDSLEVEIAPMAGAYLLLIEVSTLTL